MARSFLRFLPPDLPFMATMCVCVGVCVCVCVSVCVREEIGVSVCHYWKGRRAKPGLLRPDSEGGTQWVARAGVPVGGWLAARPANEAFSAGPPLRITDGGRGDTSQNIVNL